MHNHYTYLAVQTEEDDHYEEENGPEGREGHLRDSLGVGYEGETWSRLCNFAHTHALFVRHEAEDGEDDEAGEEARAAVGASENHRISKKNKTAQLHQKNSGTGKQDRYTFAPTG